jgi:erythromycin esterase-like protein
MEALKNHNNLNNSSEIVALLKKTASPLENIADLDPLIHCIGDAKYVLLGEASHGTHEYYVWRAKITND